LNVEQQRSATPILGADQIIAISDTGLDTGDPANIHPAFQGRVLKIYALGGQGRPIGDDLDGHGTHVAGSALGNGTSQTLGKVQGTAPGAKLVFQSLDDANGKIKPPLDLHDLLRPPFQDDNARIYSMSWGSTAGGDYNAACQEIDDFCLEQS
jgi:serine protease AprX